ncbi:unnamed protein product [Microthlaspi erraticum]|uniref:Secreted protein n=1 Tax=Microthlaspi erraticum TaxID=1685480 RepID=A0A6D2J8V5_9BRAS|nr:unnamed protein product [Microthlaspi erraticum]
MGTFSLLLMLTLLNLLIDSSPSSSLGSHHSPHVGCSLQSQTLLASLSLLRIIPSFGSPFLPHSLRHLLFLLGFSFDILLASSYSFSLSFVNAACFLHLSTS